METTVDLDEIRDAFRWKGKWRFIDVPEYHAAPLAGAAGLGLLSFGADADSHMQGDFNVLGMAPEAGVGPRTAFGMALAAEADLSASSGGTARSTGTSRRPRLLVPVRHGTPPLSARWEQKRTFHLIQARKWDWSSEHINVKETRVKLMAIRRTARHVARLGHRHLGLGDNLVGICVLEKGRASARSLAVLAQRAAAYLIGGELFHWRHIESYQNVADKDSRLFDPPGTEEREAMLKRARPPSATPLPAAQKPDKRARARVPGCPPGLPQVVEAPASRPAAPDAARVPSTRRPGMELLILRVHLLRESTPALMMRIVLKFVDVIVMHPRARSYLNSLQAQRVSLLHASDAVWPRCLTWSCSAVVGST